MITIVIFQTKTGNEKKKKVKILWKKEDNVSSSDVGTSAHRRQDDVHDCLFCAPHRHLHGDTVGQCKASSDENIVASTENTWERWDVWLLRWPVKKYISVVSGRHQTPTCQEEDVWVLVFRDFVGAFTWLHSQEADDVTDRLCMNTNQVLEMLRHQSTTVKHFALPDFKSGLWPVRLLWLILLQLTGSQCK